MKGRVIEPAICLTIGSWVTLGDLFRSTGQRGEHEILH
jgi:hypothetical protein